MSDDIDTENEISVEELEDRLLHYANIYYEYSKSHGVNNLGGDRKTNAIQLAGRSNTTRKITLVHVFDVDEEGLAKINHLMRAVNFDTYSEQTVH